MTTAQIDTKAAPAAEPLVPGSDAYNAAMIAKAEGNGVQFRVPTDDTNKSQTAVLDLSKPTAPAAADAAAKPQRPDNVPEKFWNAETGTVNTEALLKSYSELEKGKSKPAPAAAPTAPAAPVKTDAQKAAETKLAAATDDATKAAAQTELDAANASAEAAAKAAAAATPKMQDVVAAASAEFFEKGEMSNETYAALEAQGLSRDYVDAYVEGQKAKAEVVTNKVYDSVGGKDNYAAIQAWAAANLSPEQIEAANASIHSGELNAVIGAVTSLKSQYDSAMGTEGARRLEGERGSSIVPYRTKSEVTTAMRDPRYKSDPTFRREVESKVDAAMKANIDLGF